jgi:F0F1-type ATP synthase epsilon subunit
MLKTIDVGLMANHLLAHKGIIKRLELYANTAVNQQLARTLEQQIGMMRNHVQVMNQLKEAACLFLNRKKQAVFIMFGTALK